MSDSMKPIGTGLGPVFADLERRARETLDLTARVRQALTGPEKDHVLSASYRDRVLVIAVDSAAWASRLRYLQEGVLDHLRQAGETESTKVLVRVGARTE